MSKKVSYIKNYSASSKKAVMLLYDEIGVDEKTYNGINGRYFAQELFWLEEQGVETIEVRVNSPGGNVLDGFSIFSAMRAVKCNVETVIDGMACSVAGWLALAGNTCKMVDYGLVMLHDPIGPDASEKEKEVLTMVKNSITTIISGRTGKTLDEVEKLMSEETWLDAKNKHILDFVDEIIKTDKKAPKESEVVPGFAINYRNLHSIYNSIIQKPIQNMELKNAVALKLKLSNTASDEAVVEKVEETVAKVDSLEAENKTLKEENDALKKEKTDKEKEEKDAIEAKAEEFVNSLEKDGKIKAEDKAKIKNLAIVDFDTVKNTFDGMKTSVEAPKISSVIKPGEKIENKSGDDRASWTFRDFEKKDPKYLAELQNSNPEEFTKLYNSYYKK